jgi:hypothetical protein
VAEGVRRLGMTQFYDRRTMERLHQHLARADLELRDAQHFLAPDSAEEAEMGLVTAVSAARLGVTTALERVRTQLGAPEPRETPSEATPQPGRVEPRRRLKGPGAKNLRPWSPTNRLRCTCRRSVVVLYPATSRGPQSAPGGAGCSEDRSP